MRGRRAVAVMCGVAAVGLSACGTAAPAGVARSSVPPGAATTVPASTPASAPQVAVARVAVRAYHEPGDYAHRNYCGAGATEVLLSAWLPSTPDIEAVAQRAHLAPASGVTTPGVLGAVNGLLGSVVVPAVGRNWYRAEHVTVLADLEARLRADLGSAEAAHAFGHTVPVMVSTMTRTMPGWNGWQATHMVTISSIDLSHGDPALDNVTYAETPSVLAGYRGPDFQTTSVAALWTAMQAYLVDDPSDPLNVIW